MSKNPLIGKRFRSVIADCSCLFEVKATQGRGAFRCVVVNEPLEFEGKLFDSDFSGQTKLFSKSEIQRALAAEERYRQMTEEHASFYANLEVGSFVHYHYGFGQFVRCEVVVLTEATRIGIGETHAPGTKVLRARELVGPWRASDLVATAIYPMWIREGHLMCPNVSNMYEHPSFVGNPRHPVDPRVLPACVITGQQEMFG